jgi:hypothetical protein
MSGKEPKEPKEQAKALASMVNALPPEKRKVAVNRINYEFLMAGITRPMGISNNIYK